MRQAKNNNTALALILCAIPGAAQIYSGRVKKGIGFLCIFTGIVLVWIYSPSYLAKGIGILLYLSITVFPMLEIYQISRHGKPRVDTNSKTYVVFLLLTNGFAALPLLWQSNQFNRTAKVSWTLAVPLLAVAYFAFLIRYWNAMESALRVWIHRS